MEFTTKFNFDDAVFPVEYDDENEKFCVGKRFLVDEIEVRIGGNGIEDEYLIDIFGNTYEASDCFHTEKEASESAEESNQEV